MAYVEKWQEDPESGLGFVNCTRILSVFTKRFEGEGVAVMITCDSSYSNGDPGPTMKSPTWKLTPKFADYATAGAAAVEFLRRLARDTTAALIRWDPETNDWSVIGIEDSETELAAAQA